MRTVGPSGCARDAARIGEDSASHPVGGLPAEAAGAAADAGAPVRPYVPYVPYDDGVVRS